MKKAKQLLEEKTDAKQELQYVFEQLINKNYKILPDTIANGIVLKIDYEGNLETDGYEKGFLVLTPNSEIKEHMHINDIEKYTSLTGKLSVKNKQDKENLCLIGETHNIDKTQELTIIKTLKISEKLIKEIKQKIKTLSN